MVLILTFNRTSMESKLGTGAQLIKNTHTFNRTSMESKHKTDDTPLTKDVLLIEPVWNRNLTEGNRFIGRDSGLLIEPVWNRNSDQHRGRFCRLVSF